MLDDGGKQTLSKEREREMTKIGSNCKDGLARTKSY